MRTVGVVFGANCGLSLVVYWLGVGMYGRVGIGRGVGIWEDISFEVFDKVFVNMACVGVAVLCGRALGGSTAELELELLKGVEVEVEVEVEAENEVGVDNSNSNILVGTLLFLFGGGGAALQNRQ